MAAPVAPKALLIGTGEYTTGFVAATGSASQSDKRIGVVALVAFDLRKRGLLSGVDMCGTSGTKFPRIREHFAHNIRDVYNGLDVHFGSFPKDDVTHDANAFEKALEAQEPGTLVTIVTPDDTHFKIAVAAIRRGCHVLLTKPPVKTLKQHLQLVELAREHNVLVQVEYHKRFDPIYSDARERVRLLGDFSFFQSYMSQPKSQLRTFAAWAGTSSDISYYLNSHHIDIHCWMMQGRAIPRRVTAMASTGIATRNGIDCPDGTEDTITLSVEWHHLASDSIGTATYTASWCAPKSDVHSQQRFFCMAHNGEVTASQSHRGYSAATDETGLVSVNPLYMRYTPDPGSGEFAGQMGYGYTSIESFVRAASAVRAGTAQAAEFDSRLPTLAATAMTTAILEAGRRSLDEHASFEIIVQDGQPVGIQRVGV